MLKDWSSRSAAFGLAIALTAQAGWAQEVSFEGEVELTARYFPRDGALAGQPEAGVSFITATRLKGEAALTFGNIVVEAYGRTDSRTDSDIFDISKAFISGGTGSFRYKIGTDVVFWGVADATNPVNIINQEDLYSRVGSETRLSQPMLNLSYDTARLGTFDFYALFGFREPEYWTAPARLRFTTLVDGRQAEFEDKRDVDFALRNSNSLSLATGSLDYAISYFSGTERQAIFIPVQGATGLLLAHRVAPATTRLTLDGSLSGASIPSTPFFQQIEQVGVELAYATGDWVLKFEGAQRFTDHEDYFSGVIGADYSFGAVFGRGGELRVTGEYIYDGRSTAQPLTVLNDDVYASIRYDFNNARGTSLSLSALYDLETDGQIWNAEVSSRLTDQARISFSSTVIRSDNPTDPLTALDADDFHELTLSFFF